jgi:hypothetical protein
MEGAGAEFAKSCSCQVLEEMRSGLCSSESADGFSLGAHQ